MPAENEIIPIEKLIKSKALEIGFDACGISNVVQLTEESELLKNWLHKGYHGTLKYMEENTDKRADPTLIHKNAKSVISVLLNYYPQTKQPEEQYYKISKYAYGIDYHYVIKKKLNILIAYIKEELKIDGNLRAFTDSAPVFDKTWAVKSGLGWIGKNTLLINKRLGSFIFVGEIFSDVELKADHSFDYEYCGNCTACIEACPTQAILAPYQVDGRKCISYHTIETKTEIPDEIISKMNNMIFGCDICQEVCPWNKKAKYHSVPEFNLSEGLLKISRETWENMSKPVFKELFKSSPLFRPGYKKIKATIDQIKE